MEHLVLADATVACELVSGEVRAVTDRRIDDVAAEFRAVMAQHVTGSPEHQRLRVASVEAQQRLRNTDAGFWVAAAEPAAAHHAYIGSFQRGEVHRAALLSDGVARAVEWELTDWAGLLKTATETGPHAVIHQVREAEAADPDGVRWPRTKHTDDATLVVCNFDAIPSAG